MLHKNLLNTVSNIFFFCCFLSCKEIQNDKNQTLTSSNISTKKISIANNNFDYLPTSTTHDIVKHDFYTLSYNEKYEQSEWVAYKLIGKGNYTNYKRPFFESDPLVKTHSASWKNYKKSGYDKGHLCPAGDMKSSKNAYNDTFYTSNISPQNHDFNTGIWNRLEEKTRYWSVKYQGIYVVTGGVLEPGLEKIGFENVAVPKYFYKILLAKVNKTYKMIAFLVPNNDSQKPLYDFVCSVDVIEKRTGIDFFPSLSDDIENLLEKNITYKDWNF